MACQKLYDTPNAYGQTCQQGTPGCTQSSHIRGVTGRYITVAHVSVQDCVNAQGMRVPPPPPGYNGAPAAPQFGVTCGGGTSGQSGTFAGAGTITGRTEHGAVITICEISVYGRKVANREKR